MKHIYGYVEQHVDVEQEALPVVVAEVVLVGRGCNRRAVVEIPTADIGSDVAAEGNAAADMRPAAAADSGAVVADTDSVAGEAGEAGAGAVAPVPAAGVAVAAGVGVVAPGAAPGVAVAAGGDTARFGQGHGHPGDRGACRAKRPSAGRVRESFVGPRETCCPRRDPVEEA